MTLTKGNRNKLVMDAQRKAFQIRQELKAHLFAPISIFDVADKRGVEVKFVDISSMEGMYSRKPRPTILIPADRPTGRQTFSCAHELGHHEFGHSSHIDDLMESSSTSSEEFLVNAFASALLMPKSGIASAFTSRGWSLNTPDPDHIYMISRFYGVGYTTLIRHMKDTLGFLSIDQDRRLSKYQPKAIRKQILGFDHEGDLVVVDKYWAERAIDVQVGDMVLLPSNTISEAMGNSERVNLIDKDQHRSLYQATVPGLGRFSTVDGQWASFIRVSKKNYVGRSVYRHSEDPDYE